MWQNDRSAEAPGRLENLKELIRSMEEYESLPSFLEHVALVMDAEQNEEMDAVSIMTLHSAKGLEFETVFLPGWEEGLFPHQRALDEGGRSGLEEERRLAYVGITRGKKRVKIWFVSNRRIHGLWQSTIPSRFLDELPEAHVEVMEANTSYGGYGASGFGGYGASRWDGRAAFQESAYKTPGWRRAKAAAEAEERGFARGGSGTAATAGPAGGRARSATARRASPAAPAAVQRHRLCRPLGRARRRDRSAGPASTAAGATTARAPPASASTPAPGAAARARSRASWWPSPSAPRRAALPPATGSST